MSKDKQLIPLKKMFTKHEGYICGYLSILDFFYYEKTFYGVNVIEDNLQNMPIEFELAKKYQAFF